MNEPPYLPQDLIFQFILDKIDYVEKDPLNLKDKISPIAFLKEYGTFSLACGRRSGHTLLAQKIVKYFNDSIVFTVSLNMAKNQFKEYMHKKEKRVFTFHMKDFSGLDWKDKIVVVDMAYFINKYLLEQIYLKNPKFVILLG